RALQRTFQHAGNLLDPVPQLMCGVCQHPLGQIAREGDDEDREFRDVDFVDRRLVGALRQFALRVGNLCAHVLDSVGEVVARLELDQYEAAALKGGGAHLLYAFEALEGGFHWPQKQPFRILRRDPLIAEAHIDDRNGNVRLRLLGDVHIGERTRDYEEQQYGKREPCIAYRESDDIHELRILVARRPRRGAYCALGMLPLASSRTASAPAIWTFTFWPSPTRSCPATMMRVPAGMPVS